MILKSIVFRKFAACVKHLDAVEHFLSKQNKCLFFNVIAIWLLMADDFLREQLLWKSHFVFQVYHKLFTVFVLCDAYKKWIERRATCTTDKLYDLEWRFYECLLQSATEMFAFFAVILVTAGSIKSGVHLRRILEATCAGYFGKSIPL